MSQSKRTKESRVKILREALKWLGPRGKNWGSGKTGEACAWTALHSVLHPDNSASETEEADYWARVLGFKSAHLLFAWNDAPERKFSEVKERFNEAIRKAA